jgi:hypothetical protein
MANLIRNEDGTVFTTKPGVFTAMNNESGSYVPGETILIRDKKLFTYTDNKINPYRGTVKLLEVQLPFCFVSIDNSWYTFRVRQNDEGENTFITSRTHYRQVNGNYDAAYKAFQQLIADDIAINEAKQAREDAQKAAADVAAVKLARINQVKTLKLQALADLKTALASKNLDNILMDSEVCEIVDRYNKYALILSAL